MQNKAEIEICAAELYKTLFAEYGITFIGGLEGEREDILARAFYEIAKKRKDVVKIFTDKERSSFLDYPLERLNMTDFGGAAEKIAPLLKGCRLVVLDLKIFSNCETFFDYSHMTEALSLSELAKSANVNFIIPAHFNKPFSAWRNFERLCGRYVQVVKLFNDRGNRGINIFGGKNS